jgi:hypothetical protein
MSSERVPDPDYTRHPKMVEDGQQILAKDTPVVRRSRLAATPVPARIKRQAPPLGKLANDGVPAAPVKTGRVRKE